MDCGDDSFMVTPRVVGVADGVGGWRKQGIDPSHFANKMMEYCKDLVQKEKMQEPLSLMQTAYKRIVHGEEPILGSSTVCLASMEPSGNLTVANLGDSGLVVVRDGRVVFQSEMKTWQFNTPYQLTGPPKGFPKGFAIGDQPESSAMGKVQVEPGDVVVLGSDGLWDNLFPQQIADIVSAANAEGKTSCEIADILKQVAFATSLDRDVTSPIQVEAQQHGKLYKGGKPDDITVVVARVVSKPVAGGDAAAVRG
jgi:protein phosphatase PTC7